MRWIQEELWLSLSYDKWLSADAMRGQEKGIVESKVQGTVCVCLSLKVWKDWGEKKRKINVSKHGVHDEFKHFICSWLKS